MSKPKKTVLAHRVSSERQAVEATLNVLVCPAEAGGYVAHGIEIFHVATGPTEEVARENFAASFVQTIAAYLQRGRPMDGLFKTATPREIVMQYFASKSPAVFQCVVLESSVEIPAAVPRNLAFRHADACVPA